MKMTISFDNTDKTIVIDNLVVESYDINIGGEGVYRRPCGTIKLFQDGLGEIFVKDIYFPLMQEIIKQARRERG